jgi:multiple sugar transport system ATP-binding protein
MAALTLRLLDKAYGPVQVLSRVSLEVADGEFLSLLGPSGCGKSTLLRLVAGLDHPDAGAIEIDGRDVGGLAPKARDVAMVFQNYALYPHLSVAGNLALPLAMRRLTFAQRLPLLGRWLPGTRKIATGIERDVAETAGALGIGPLLARKPAQLSGGQKQRVALGRAMVRRPRLFLMDEPLSNLDAHLRTQLRGEICALHQRLGATFIYVTHDQHEAMTMSSRVAVMLGGRLLQVATPQEIYDDPASLQVAEFVGSPRINVLPAEVDAAGRVSSFGVALQVRTARHARRIQVACRPESFEVASAGDSSIRATVERLEHLGSEVLAHVRAPDGTPAVVRIRSEAAPRLRAGDPVGLRPRTDRVLAFDESGARLTLVAEAALRAVHG